MIKFRSEFIKCRIFLIDFIDVFVCSNARKRFMRKALSKSLRQLSKSFRRQIIIKFGSFLIGGETIFHIEM